MDIATQENAATLAATVFGWWRKDVALDVSNRYWRDVHSVMVARIPGIYQYRLLQLEPNCPQLWTPIDGINYTLPDTDQPHGIAEMLFLTEADQQRFGQHPINTQFVLNDEKNLCDRNVTLSAIGNNAHTFVDRTNAPTPNGTPAFPSFLICLQPTKSIQLELFRQHLVEQIAKPWSQNAAIVRLRLHLLEPYNEKSNSPFVSHDCTTAQNYRAWIELVTQDQTVLKSLFTEGDHADRIRAIHTFPISACYTMIANAHLTDVGLRGFAAVQTILEAGADNQRQPDLLKALYGFDVE